jgi:hypothetical protein
MPKGGFFLLGFVLGIMGIAASLWVLWVIPLRYGVYFTQPTQSLRSKRLYPISPEQAPLAALPIAPNH